MMVWGIDCGWDGVGMGRIGLGRGLLTFNDCARYVHCVSAALQVVSFSGPGGYASYGFRSAPRIPLGPERGVYIDKKVAPYTQKPDEGSLGCSSQYHIHDPPMRKGYLPCTAVLLRIHRDHPQCRRPAATILTSTALAQSTNPSSLLVTACGRVVDVADDELGLLITKKAWGRNKLTSMLGRLSIESIKAYDHATCRCNLLPGRVYRQFLGDPGHL